MRSRLLVILLLASSKIAAGQDEPPLPRQDVLRQFALNFDPVTAAGLPAGSRAIVLRWDTAYRIALAPGDAKTRQDQIGNNSPLSAEEFTRLRASMSAPRDVKAPPFRDPTSEMLVLLEKLHRAESSRRPVIAFEQSLKLYQVYVRGGASSGVTNGDVNQVAINLFDARQEMLKRTAEYRDALDEMKLRFGLPINLPLVADWGALDAFTKVFVDLDWWATKQENEYDELIPILERLPKRPDVTIAGQSFDETARRSGDGGADLLATVMKTTRDANSAVRTRSQLRRLSVISDTYDMDRTRLRFLIMARDVKLQRMIAPPARGDAKTNAKEQSNQTTDLLRSIADIESCKDRIVSLWLEGQSLRHGVACELDTLPKTRDEFIGELAPRVGVAPKK